MRVLNKIRRELFKPLSKLCLKSARVSYFGLNLKVPLIHGHGAGYLLPGDEWMSKCLSVFLKNKLGAVIDIGANIGLYMVKLKALDQNRDYYGFEPNPVCNFYTYELISANNFKNVRMFPFALSNQKELRTFYAKRKADKMGSLHEYARYGQEKENSFDLFTFSGDEFIRLLEIDKICSMKIDVEGFELEVLTGLQETLKQFKPYIFCEIWHLPEKGHPTFDEKFKRSKSICQLLESLDYHIYGVTEKDNSIVRVQNVGDFSNEQRGDYILVHSTEADHLIQAFN